MVKNQMQFKKEMYKLPLSKKYHFRDNNNNYKYQKNDYDYNYNNSNNNYIESTTQNSDQNNNYIMGSNLPHFTSFNFHSKKKGNSFPSRHLFSYLLISVLLWSLCPPAGILMTISGLLLAVIRVILGVHYPSDVVAGMILGVFSGLITLLFDPKLS